MMHSMISLGNKVENPEFRCIGHPNISRCGVEVTYNLIVFLS